jgi:hypothetical protein
MGLFTLCRVVNTAHTISLALAQWDLMDHAITGAVHQIELEGGTFSISPTVMMVQGFSRTWLLECWPSNLREQFMGNFLFGGV